MTPVLFSLFLNDLNTSLLNDASGITLWDRQICAMLYADNLILLAESEEDLQNQMNSLGKYANSLKNGNKSGKKPKPKVLAFDKPTNTENCISKVWSSGN